MKTLAACLVILISFPSSIFAADESDSCPLSNAAYKNLRSAAMALEQKVLLPEGCEDLSKKLNEANLQVSSASTALTQITPGQTAEAQNYVRSASAGIVQIGQLFDRFGKTNDRCGRALLSMSDYLVAFIETVNGLTPLLLSFGGPASLPQAMGVMILGAAVKTFIVYYQTLSIDMSGANARQAFITNACGYHRLNEMIRSLLQTLKGEMSEIDQRVEQLARELKELEAIAPPAPIVAPRFAEMDAALKSERQFFSDFSGTFERTAATPALACALVRSQVAASKKGAFPSPALERLRTLVNESLLEGRKPTADQNLLESAYEMNQSKRFVINELQAPICVIRARDWLGAMSEILSATDRQLALPGRKDLSETEQGKARKAWEALYEKKKKEFAAAEERQKFVRALAVQGADIELSELLDTRDKIRRDLFGDRTDSALFGLTHRQGPAESWLRHKWRSAEAQLKDYRKVAPYFRRSWLKDNVTVFPGPTEKAYACAYGENLVMGWITAEKDAAASRLFCTAFQHTINEATHPYVTEFCIGNFTSDGELDSAGKVGELEKRLNKSHPEIQRIATWMKNAGCDIPKPLQGSLQ